MSVAKRLDDALERSGRSANQIAREAGIATGALSYYRRGERDPSTTTVARLSEALGVREAWLLTGERPMRRNAEVIHERALFEVDGLLSQWDQPTEPDAREAEKAFYSSFRRFDGIRFRTKLVGTVHLVFTNLLARVMLQLRRAGQDTRGVERAEWRGEIAGRVLGRINKRVQAARGRDAFDRDPDSTRLWLAEIAAEMQAWEDTVPPDFNVED